MSEYKPDRWVVLKITNEDKVGYKVMGGWYGGYLGSDSWRINSGISKIELIDNTYKFHGNSGSVYVCHKDGYGVTVLMSSVIPDDDRLEILPKSDFTLLNLEVDRRMTYLEARNSGYPFNRRKYIDGWYIRDLRRNIDYAKIDLSQRFWTQADLEADDWWTEPLAKTGVNEKN